MTTDPEIREAMQQILNSMDEDMREAIEALRVARLQVDLLRAENAELRMALAARGVA